VNQRRINFQTNSIVNIAPNDESDLLNVSTKAGEWTSKLLGQSEFARQLGFSHSNIMNRKHALNARYHRGFMISPTTPWRQAEMAEAEVTTPLDLSQINITIILMSLDVNINQPYHSTVPGGALHVGNYMPPVALSPPSRCLLTDGGSRQIGRMLLCGVLPERRKHYCSTTARNEQRDSFCIGRCTGGNHITSVSQENHENICNPMTNRRMLTSTQHDLVFTLLLEVRAMVAQFAINTTTLNANQITAITGLTNDTFWRLCNGMVTNDCVKLIAKEYNTTRDILVDFSLDNASPRNHPLNISQIKNIIRQTYVNSTYVIISPPTYDGLSPRIPCSPKSC